MTTCYNGIVAIKNKMTERKYNIQADVDVEVLATSKKEAIEKAKEILKSLQVHSFVVNSPQRTKKQNNSIHKYCELLAHEFNEAGLDMKLVLKPKVDIEWNTESVKKYIWKPIQKSLFGIESTTKLKRGEKQIEQIWEHINRHLSQRFAEWIKPIPFPSIETQTKETKLDYPDYEGSPEF